MQLDNKQEEAVKLGSDTELFIASVTGKAGTGKTTILKKVHSNLLNTGMSPILCSPTGKAAKRIQEATGLRAMTIHRLLEYGYPQIDETSGQALYQPRPRRNEDNRLPFNAVLVDEASMLTQELATNLMKALPDESIIRLFGDVNQLPPVEPHKKSLSSPFQKVLKNHPSVYLETVYRQDKDSGIFMNSLNVLDNKPLIEADDFIIDSPSNLERYLDQYDFTSPENQIITTTNIGHYGTKKMNPYLQKRLNDSHQTKTVDRKPWDKSKILTLKLNDKVMITGNTCVPEYEAYNGEAGIFTNPADCSIDFGDRELQVPKELHVNRGMKTITLKPQTDIDLAYAVTTHKAQGGEYDVVLYLDCGPFKDKHNQYTAITRARKKCIYLTT